MQYKTFANNKLWRDKMIERAIAQDSKIDYTVLDDAKFNIELKNKLLEESQEVYNASTPEELIEECADIFEVMEELLKLNKISLETVKTAQIKKFAERGGFESRKFVKTLTCPVDSYLERYCSNRPEKYPEITKVDNK